MGTQENNPLRAPWHADRGVVIDCDGKVVTVLTRRSDEGVCGRAVVATPRMLDLLMELVAIEGAQPGTAAWAAKVNTLLAEVRP